MTDKLIIDGPQLTQLLGRLAAEIARDVSPGDVLGLVGIRSRGAVIAQRLQTLLADQHGLTADLGTLDITLYRDDLGQMGYKQPIVKTTEIDFSLDDRVIILIDDVIKTGRSTRAALNALMDLGRARMIRLAVLIDRGYRELPITPDYVGQAVATDPAQRVFVHLREIDQNEKVVVGSAQ